MKKDTIRICFVCDEKFVNNTIVTIGSIKECRFVNDVYETYVIANDLNSYSKEMLLGLQEPNFNITVIECNLNQGYPKQLWAEHVSETALLKFEIMRIFDKFDKILYLDSDILILKDIKYLFNINIDNCYVAAVRDWRACDGLQALNPDADYNDYFNSGVMLLNLEKIRKNKIYEKVIDYRINGKNFYMDQDAFNAGFKGRVKYLPLFYNAMTSSIWHYDFERIKEFYILRDERITDFYRNVVVLHFSSGCKPWDFYDIPFSNVWRNVYQKYVRKKINRTSTSHTNIKDKYLAQHMARDVIFEKALLKKIGMKRECKISIIMPVYNAEKYVRKTIDSILAQTFNDFELIIVDDASTDKSFEICTDIAGKYDNIHLIKMPQNGGQGLARNEGVRHAKGKYITFLDADDEFLPTALEIFYEKAEYYSADVVSSVGWMSEKGTVIFNKNIVEEEKLSKDFATRMNIFCEKKIPFEVWNKIYNKEFLQREKITFENVSPIEDMVYNVYCICLAEKYVVIPDVVNFYRQTPVSSVRGHKRDIPIIAKRMKMLVDSASCLEHFFYVRGLHKKYPTLCSRIKSFVIGQAMEHFFFMLGVFPMPMYELNRDIPYDLERAARELFHDDMGKGQAWMLIFLMHEIIRYRNDEERKNYSEKWNEYAFPFHLFPPKARVVIYGAGEAGKKLYKEGKKYDYLEIVGIVDKAYAKRCEKNLHVENISMLHNWSYDYVLIAIRDEAVSREVKSSLIDMGIKAKKIKWGGDSYLKQEFYNNVYLRNLKKMYEM